MPDKFTKEKRSYIMSKIKSTSTTPELKLKKVFKLLGFQHQPKNIYGKPDFANKKSKIVVFIDGCFWHKCPKCFIEPETRKEFWMNKINGNVKRDKEVSKLLKKEGWKVIRIWEHEIKNNPKRAISRAKKPLINKISSEDAVTHRIMQFLRKHGWDIIQYHPPGGQANLPIKTNQGIVFPDIVAVKDSVILVAENKRSPNQGDIDKLSMMLKDERVHQQVISYCLKYCQIHSIPIKNSYTLKWAHGFGGTNTPPQHGIINYILAGNDFEATIVPSLKDPLLV